MKKRGMAIDYIYRSVQTGLLKNGDYLPSVRRLAKQLGLSTSPIYAAYAHLETLEIVKSVERVGFRLIGAAKIPPGIKYDMPPVPIPELVRNYNYISNRSYDYIIPFGGDVPSGQYFPNEDLRRCLSHSARKFQDVLNIYGFANNKLRSVCNIEDDTARYIFRVHGFSISSDEFCQTSGANESIYFALRTLAKPGDLVAIESPGYLNAYINLARLYLKPLEIKTSFPDGLDLDELEDCLIGGARPKCLIVTPNFQNPTGAMMPAGAREHLLALSREYDFVIIEDDTLGALRFGERLPSLKEQDPDGVVYVSSHSKTFAPGYSVGWAAGGKHSFNIKALYMLESLYGSVIGHLAVADYIRSGKCYPQIKNLRMAYRENKDLMTSLIRDCFPAGTKMTAPLGGQYLWVTLPCGVSAEKIYYAALEHNILLAPGNLFSENLRFDGNLRFCYAMPITKQIIDSLEIVGSLIKAEVSK
jgi:DNA-binding transcriptional MocR family regulator